MSLNPFSAISLRLPNTHNNGRRQRPSAPARRLGLAAVSMPAQTTGLETCILAKNEEAEACTASAAAWLLTAPRGAYTTARTVGGTSVFELSFHIARLASSARLMLEADMREGRPGAEALWQQYSGALGDPTALRPRVEASLRAGVAFYHQALASRGLASSMIASSNGSGSSSSRGSGNGSSAAAAPEPELRLTVLLTWGPGGAEVWSHVSTLPPRPAPPVRVEVRGAPRSNAAAKDSKWVLQRRELEQSMGPGVNEVLLSAPGGRVLEGLSSNFFAVVGGAVHTAGEGVLAGSVRHLILELARREGIPVVLTPPRLADLDSWEGCFISSTSRLLLPVDELLLLLPPGHGAAAGMAGANGAGRSGAPSVGGRRFPGGGLVRRLEGLVLREVQATSEPLFA